MDLRKCLCSLAFVFVLSLPSMANAEGNLHYGPIRFHPHFTLKESYTTNIFATESSRFDDYITTFRAGLGLKLPFRRHLLFLDYTVIDVNHDDFTDEDTTDQSGTALLNFELGNNLGFSLEEKYRKGHESRGASATGAIELYKHHDATVTLKRKLADISMLQLDYSFLKRDFGNPANAFREREHNIYSAYLYFKVLPKTSVFIEYDHEDVDYKSTDTTAPVGAQSYDNESDRAILGFKWDITDRSTGMIKGGYSWKEYDLDTIDEYGTWVAVIDLTHTLDRYTSFYVNANRSLKETSLQSTRYFVSSAAFVEIRHRFYRDRFLFSMRGSRAEEKFSDIVFGATEKRVDQRYSGGASFSYDIQEWLNVALVYDFIKRNSNEDTNDYIDNRTSLSFNLMF